MKKLIILLVLLPLFFVCEKAVVDYPEDKYLVVANPLSNMDVDEGVIETEIDITDVFKVQGDANAQIVKSIYDVQNSALVSAKLDGNTLTITVHIGEAGSSQITLRAEWAGKLIYESFIFKVNAITASTALNRAIQHFQSGEYQQAEDNFLVLISKNNIQYQADAYMGLGFSQMRNDNAPDGYISMQTSITLNAANIDARAGMSLLEYAYAQNYASAIQYGQEVLSANSDFVFRYDSNLDKNDMLVNIALSQYALQLWSECLATVNLLDPAYNLDLNDPDYKTKLFQKLEELVLLYG